MKNFSNKRAETLLEVIIALFIVGMGVTTSSMILNRALNVTASNQLWVQAAFFAKEGVEAVRNIRDTNWIKFAPEDCWKTRETGNVCDPATSPMMADSANDENYYAIFFDYIDFTWNLEGPITSTNEFTNGAILSRLPNNYSIHEKLLSPSAAPPDSQRPIYIEDVSGADNTNFYRQIKIEHAMLNVDNDSSTTSEEVLIVTSTVKWPYRNKVNTYGLTTILTNYRQ